MLRPYRSSEATTFRAASTFKYNWRSRMVFVFGLPLLLVASLVGVGTELYGFDSRYNGVRKLVLQCIHSIYAEGTKAALDMPKPPTVTASLEIPSTYAICQVCPSQNVYLPVVQSLQGPLLWRFATKYKYIFLTLYPLTGVDSTRRAGNHRTSLHPRR